MHFSGTRSDSSSFYNFTQQMVDLGFFRISPVKIVIKSVGGLSWMHPFFQRGKSELLYRITRIDKEKARGGPTKKSVKKTKKKKDVPTKKICSSSNESDNKSPDAVSSTPQALSCNNEPTKSGYDSDGSEDSLVF